MLKARRTRSLSNCPRGTMVSTFGSASLEEHGSTLHLVQSLEAHRNRIDEAPSEAASSRLPSLPARRTPLIGREQELAALKKLLISGSPRLITLTGAGGSGKTRLGLQAASEVIAEFPGGVYFVALASITDPTLSPRQSRRSWESGIPAANPWPRHSRTTCGC